MKEKRMFGVIRHHRDIYVQVMMATAILLAFFGIWKIRNLPERILHGESSPFSHVYTRSEFVVEPKHTITSDPTKYPTSSSFWHDVPLLSRERSHSSGTIEGHVLNFVCEIPIGSLAKMEIQKTLLYNPIMQDTKNDQPRYYPWASLVNYGALPQTYEHPDIRDIFTNVGGDGDPLDAVDLDPQPCFTGEVYPVRILGALALMDEDATDWKIITARVGGAVERKIQDLSFLNNPIAPQGNDTPLRYLTTLPNTAFATHPEVPNTPFAPPVGPLPKYAYPGAIPPASVPLLAPVLKSPAVHAIPKHLQPRLPVRFPYAPPRISVRDFVPESPAFVGADPAPSRLEYSTPDPALLNSVHAAGATYHVAFPVEYTHEKRIYRDEYTHAVLDELMSALSEGEDINTAIGKEERDGDESGGAQGGEGGVSIRAILDDLIHQRKNSVLTVSKSYAESAVRKYQENKEALEFANRTIRNKERARSLREEEMEEITEVEDHEESIRLRQLASTNTTGAGSGQKPAENMEQWVGGLLHALVTWFREYKYAASSNGNSSTQVRLTKLLFGGHILSSDLAVQLVTSGYKHWCLLMLQLDVSEQIQEWRTAAMEGRLPELDPEFRVVDIPASVHAYPKPTPVPKQGQNKSAEEGQEQKEEKGVVGVRGSTKRGSTEADIDSNPAAEGQEGGVRSEGEGVATPSPSSTPSPGTRIPRRPALPRGFAVTSAQQQQQSGGALQPWGADKKETELFTPAALRRSFREILSGLTLAASAPFETYISTSSPGHHPINLPKRTADILTDYEVGYFLEHAMEVPIPMAGKAIGLLESLAGLPHVYKEAERAEILRLEEDIRALPKGKAVELSALKNKLESLRKQVFEDLQYVVLGYKPGDEEIPLANTYEHEPARVIQKIRPYLRNPNARVCFSMRDKPQPFG